MIWTLVLRLVDALLCASANYALLRSVASRCVCVCVLIVVAGMVEEFAGMTNVVMKYLSSHAALRIMHPGEFSVPRLRGCRVFTVLLSQQPSAVWQAARRNGNKSGAMMLLQHVLIHQGTTRTLQCHAQQSHD